MLVLLALYLRLLVRIISGTHTQFQALLYDQDPLWDGQGCGVGYSACCSFNSPPWFCKELPHATTDDIELRMCGDHLVEDEATLLELIKLYYVQQL